MFIQCLVTITCTVSLYRRGYCGVCLQQAGIGYARVSVHRFILCYVICITTCIWFDLG